MRDEHDVVSDHFKSMLITEYVRKHPGVHPSQVVVKSVNGKSVCDVISNAFKRSILKKARPSASKNLSPDELRKQLETREQERYETSLNSVRSSASLIDFLLASPHHPFGPVDKKENTDFFKRCMTILATRTETVTHIKTGFMQVMDGVENATPARIKGLMISFLEAVFEQLKAQGSVFKREFDLGNGFCTCVVELMKASVPGVKSQLSPDDALLVARAYKTMKSAGGAEPADLSMREVGALDNSVKELQSQLEKRRAQFDAIERIVDFLENLIQSLRQQLEEESKTDGDKKSRGPGMVFAQRSTRGSKRGR